MNCQEFEQIVAELVTDNLSSARTRIAAMTHAAACEHCDARLSAEKMLDAGLVAVAERTGNEQASPQLRQSLRAAFEAQQAKETVAAPEIKANWLEAVKAIFSWQQNWGWSLAGAAAVVVVAVGVSIWWKQQALNQSQIVAVASPTPTVMPSPKATQQSAEPVSEQATNLASQAQVGENKNVKRLAVPRRQQRIQVQSNQNNMAANFIPLSYAAGSVTPDESLVVRVDVPRTTLIAMGLPLSTERGHEMVKADLRVGMDGVPLAIRLVR